MRCILGLSAAALFLAALPAGAQGRRAAPMARPVLQPSRQVVYVRPAPRVSDITAPTRVVSVAPRRPAYSPRPGTFSFSSGGSGTPAVVSTNINGTPIPLEQLLNPAPGQGFDFTHLAAVDSSLAVRALIDPLTQQELALAARLPRTEPAAFFGGFGDYAAEPLVIQSPTPQVIVIQEPAAQPPSAPSRAEAPAPPAVVAHYPAPALPPVGEFLLVLRDKTVVHAIAFTREGHEIVYITDDGSRRSISFDQLNVQATEERNAERGAILHLE